MAFGFFYVLGFGSKAAILAASLFFGKIVIDDNMLDDLPVKASVMPIGHHENQDASEAPTGGESALLLAFISQPSLLRKCQYRSRRARDCR